MSLSSIEKPVDRAPVVTITGDSGIGKTSLSCTFPNPIVIRGEDGLQAVAADKRPDAFPLLQNPDQLWDELGALIKEDHQYRTLIIDSVTALERMFIQHIVESDPKMPKSINQAMGGYGAGLQAVAAMHQRVRKAAGILNERRGMSIVFVAHADTEVIELPDQDPYTRYSLRLGKRSMAPYIDDSDIVGFLRLQTFTVGDGARKKAISDGTRNICCYATAANFSKNRFGISQDIEVKQGENPFIGIIPGIEGEKS